MSEFKPWRILHLDLDLPLPELPCDEEVGGLYLVFWLAGVPLGREEVPSALLPLTRAELGRLAAAAIAPAARHHLLGRGPAACALPERATSDPAAELRALARLERPLGALDATLRRAGPSATRPTVSVVVCTRDRPQPLARCLRALAALREPPLEILVVDNAPGTDAPREVVAAHPGVQYLHEPRPGLSVARNTGIESARGEIVAFTDDDATVHRDWLGHLRRGFEEPAVMAVTGAVFPRELETEAQLIAERRLYGFNRDLRPRLFDARFFREMEGIGAPVWTIGAGANMAIRREAFALVGLYDERLGAGAAGCSEDSELFYRLLASGHACLYQPSAVVFHEHRRELRALDEQWRQYMRGHVAALLVQFARHRHAGNLRRLFLTLPAHHVRQLAASFRRPEPRGRRLLLCGAKGSLAGVLYYARPKARGTRHKPALGRFLACNPFPDPLSGGLFYRAKMRALHRIAPDLPAAKVLEVGGGRSGLTSLLYPRARVTNVDLDRPLGRSEPNLWRNVRFVLADASRLPFPAESFDVVTMFDVLEHVPDDRRALDEAVRVLKPGGVLLVSTPNEQWRFPYHGFLRRLCPSEEEIMREWGHVRRGYEVEALGAWSGLMPLRRENFLGPLGTLAHDVYFSKLPPGLRRALCLVLAPLAWLAYLAQRPDGPGLETASAWLKPALDARRAAESG